MERSVLRLCNGFRFKKLPVDAAFRDYCALDYDDSSWAQVRVPHDWAADGVFSAENDPSYQSIVQDGVITPIVHTGRTGGLPIVGCGIYRKWLDIDKDAAGKDIYLEFDGVIMPDCNAENYPDTLLGRHRLYTALSRATRRLTVLARGAMTPLLEK